MPEVLAGVVTFNSKPASLFDQDAMNWPREVSKLPCAAGIPESCGANRHVSPSGEVRRMPTR